MVNPLISQWYHENIEATHWWQQIPKTNFSLVIYWLNARYLDLMKVLIFDSYMWGLFNIHNNIQIQKTFSKIQVMNIVWDCLTILERKTRLYKQLFLRQGHALTHFEMHRCTVQRFLNLFKIGLCHNVEKILSIQRNWETNYNLNKKGCQDNWGEITLRGW